MQIYKYKYLPTYLPIEHKNIKTISGMQWISTLLFYSFCFQITYLKQSNNKESYLIFKKKNLDIDQLYASMLNLLC